MAHDFESALRKMTPPPPIAQSHIGRYLVTTRELGYESNVIVKGELTYSVRYDTHEEALAGHRAIAERLQDGDTRFLVHVRPPRHPVLARFLIGGTAVLVAWLTFITTYRIIEAW